MSILLVIAILVFLIVAHELGHFIAAKISGVKVEEFGVGYPPRAFTFGTWSGTEYTLNWLPFGGFVRLHGDVGEAEHGPGTLNGASRLKQALILSAGVFMNAVVAWGLFTYAYSIGVPHVADEPTAETRLMVTEVLPGSPIEVAGVKPGDVVVAVRDDRNAAPQQLAPAAITQFVRDRAGKELNITYVRTGATSTVAVRPAHAVISQTSNEPAIGVGLVLVADEALPFGRALIAGLVRTTQEAVTIVDRLGALIRSIGGSDSSLIKSVVGPVGLVGVVGDAAQNGWGYIIGLTAIISINLAVINLVPVPALDGGRLLLLGVEAILRRPAPRGVVSLLNAFGIACIALLMIVVTYNDIARLLA